MYAPVDIFAVYNSARVRNVTVDMTAFGRIVIADDDDDLLLLEELEMRGV